MKIYPFSKIVLIFLFSLLLMVPVSAQTVTEGEELDTVEITFSGHISFDEEGNVYIDGYFLAPAGAISPSELSDGQYVEVTGIFLNDDTFQLTEIDTSVEEPTCDVTGATEDTADDCVEEPVEEPTCDATGATEDTADDCVEEPVCEPDGHPVAARIADAFDVDACEVEEMHDEGNGFGNIARAYLLAEAANLALVDGEGEPIDAQYFIDMHEAGMGWGQIVKDSGVHPSDLAPGKLKKRAANDDDTDTSDDTGTLTTTESNTNNGNGNSNANANSNNGNGNSNANANSNNGNGNSNANANSNNGNGNGNANANSNNGNSNKDKNKDKGNKGKKKK